MFTFSRYYHLLNIMQRKIIFIFFFGSLFLARGYTQDWQFFIENANYNYQIGKFEHAKSFAASACDLALINYGNSSLNYAMSLNSLGEIVSSMGDFIQAESLFTISLKIKKDYRSTHEHSYLLTLNNIATLYFQLNFLDKAERIYKECIYIIEPKKEKYLNIYLGCLHNLSGLYRKTNRIAEAESLLILVSISSGELQKGSIEQNINFLNNQAVSGYSYLPITYCDSLLSLAKELIIKHLNENHPLYASTLCNQAFLYSKSGQFDKAEQMYFNALSVQKRILGDRHPDYLETLNNFAAMYFASNNMLEAEKIYHQVIDLITYQIKLYVPGFNENERIQFWEKVKSYFDAFNLFAIQRFNSNPFIASSMYKNQVMIKSLLLNTSIKTKTIIKKSNDIKLIKKYDDWITTREKIAGTFLMSIQEIDKTGLKIDSLIKRASELEKELSKITLTAETFINPDEISWLNVKSVLNHNAAAIEFIRIYNTLDETTYYCALIISDSTLLNPDLLIIYNGTELEDQLYSNYRRSLKHHRVEHDSYQYYWASINEKIKNKKKLYISSDGIYNKINLESLYNLEGNYLFDIFEIHPVLSTYSLIYRKLADDSFKLTDNCVAYLFGDPKFSASSHNNISVSIPNAPLLNDEFSNRFKNIQLEELPGTREEVTKIQEILKMKRIPVICYLREDATEDRIKKISSACLIHIATHGLFITEEKSIGLSSVKNLQNISNPLFGSVLFLSHAIDFIQGRYIKTNEKSEDGILTAYEIMNLNLENCELVVLSGCETGLGNILNGEGVYGMQRAFQISGVKTIVMSLFKVSDEVTNTLMQYFYKYLVDGNNKYQALLKAKKKLKQIYNSPYFWGAFILIDEQMNY